MSSSLLGIRHPDVGRIFGSYRVLALLGEGGMGLVYLAEHVRLGRKVALKRLKERYVARPELVQSFFEEARAVNRISHPNIVEITDFVKDPEQAYYIMEFLTGRSLGQELQSEGVLEVRRTLDIAYQVTGALSAAHEEGIVHMDIKPSNIFIGQREGRSDFVKLLDFGVAQLEAVEGPVKNETDPAVGRQRLGTPVYMSPEQFQAGPVDHRSDLYSLGVVLYEILSGQPPFRAKSTAEYAYKHINKAPVPLNKIKGFPHRIARTCSRTVMRCLAKDPADRFHSAEELKDALQRAAHTTGIQLQTGKNPVLTQPSSPRRLAMAVTVAVVLMLAVGVMGVLLFGGPPDAGAEDKKAKGAAAPALDDAKPRAGKVTLEIKTVPSGAQVRRVTPEPKTLGMTPLKLTIARSGDRWNVVIRLKGYRDRKLTLALDRERVLSFELQPLSARAGGRPDGRALDPASSPDGGVATPGTESRKDRRRRRRKRRRRRRGTKKGTDSSGTVNPFNK